MARALTEDEKLLVRRAMDKLSQAEKRYTVTNTGFLTELEQDILMTELKDCVIWTRLRSNLCS